MGPGRGDDKRSGHSSEARCGDAGRMGPRARDGLRPSGIPPANGGDLPVGSSGIEYGIQHRRSSRDATSGRPGR